MSSIPSILPIPRIQDAFAPDGTPADPNYEQRCDRFFREFEWYAEALESPTALKRMPSWPNRPSPVRR